MLRDWIGRAIWWFLRPRLERAIAEGELDRAMHESFDLRRAAGRPSRRHDVRVVPK